VSFPNGHIAEGGFQWQVQFDYEDLQIVDDKTGSKQSCPHAHSERLELQHSVVGSEYYYAYWIVPRVIVAFNEGGYAGTVVCLDCVLEGERSL
jgi:hypothetical protein